MSFRLPRITAKQMIPAVERGGCSFIQQKGSHRIYRTPNGRRIAVPCHAGKTLHPRVIKSILKGLRMSVEELRELL